jgi:hypothetical protein
MVLREGHGKKATICDGPQYMVANPAGLVVGKVPEAPRTKLREMHAMSQFNTTLHIKKK